MATVKCALGQRSGSTHEWNDGVKDHIYCYGYIDKKNDEPLPECLACPDHVYKAQEDMDRWRESMAPGRRELYEILLDRKCPAWVSDNFNALQTADFLLSRGVTIQKTGNWSLRCEAQKGHMDEVDEVFYLECSECRRKVWDISQDDALKGNWAKLIEPFPYCHCGAKMHTSCGEEVKQR